MPLPPGAPRSRVRPKRRGVLAEVKATVPQEERRDVVAAYQCIDESVSIAQVLLFFPNGN